MKLTDLLDVALSKCNTLRGIVRQLDKPEAYDLWQKSTKEEQETLINAVNNNDRKAVLQWVRYHPHRELYEYTRKELNALAVKHRIPNYTRIPTYQLIEVIYEKEGKNRVHRKPTPNRPSDGRKN